MEAYDVIQIAKAYRDLGWAVQEQMDTVLDGQADEASLNPNALDMIEAFFKEAEQYRLDTGCERGMCEEAREKIAGSHDEA